MQNLCQRVSVTLIRTSFI